MRHMNTSKIDLLYFTILYFDFTLRCSAESSKREMELYKHNGDIKTFCPNKRKATHLAANSIHHIKNKSFIHNAEALLLPSTNSTYILPSPSLI